MAIYPQSNPFMVNAPPEQPVRTPRPHNSGSLTPWAVAAAIPGSIGSLDEIAKNLGVPRLELRRFIAKNKELREALDDELLAAKERLIKQTYSDGMDGQPQARQDFFKMVNGYFEKKTGKEEEMARSQVIIHLDAPSEKVKMIGEDGDIIDIPRSSISALPPPNKDTAGELGQEADDDDDDYDDDDDDETDDVMESNVANDFI